MLRDMLTQRGDLEAGTVQNVAGEEVTAWALWQADIPVLVRQARLPADLRLGVDESVSHVIYSMPLPDVLAEPQRPWRLVVEGRTYVIVDAQDAAARRHHMEIRARRLE